MNPYYNSYAYYNMPNNPNQQPGSFANNFVPGPIPPPTRTGPTNGPSSIPRLGPIGSGPSRDGASTYFGATGPNGSGPTLAGPFPTNFGSSGPTGYGPTLAGSGPSPTSFGATGYIAVYPPYLNPHLNSVSACPHVRTSLLGASPLNNTSPYFSGSSRDRPVYCDNCRTAITVANKKNSLKNLSAESSDSSKKPPKIQKRPEVSPTIPNVSDLANSLMGNQTRWMREKFNSLVQPEYDAEFFNSPPFDAGFHDYTAVMKKFLEDAEKEGEEEDQIPASFEALSLDTVIQNLAQEQADAQEAKKAAEEMEEYDVSALKMEAIEQMQQKLDKLKQAVMMDSDKKKKAF